MRLNPKDTQRAIAELWRESIVDELKAYIRIPNKSPTFDPEWAEKGHMDEAVSLMVAWCNSHAVDGMTVEVLRLPGRTPLIFIDVPGQVDSSVLLYGHLDKQPEMCGWRPDLGPWKPVVDDDKLYGRGGADDGYAVFAALAAIRSLHEQGVAHAHLRILIEASEESGSPDLPAYVEALGDRLGQPNLVICLDSGCGNYEQLWCTTSLRGMAGGTLSVSILDEGVHSGDASGIVPSTFRITRALLDRLEDSATGTIVAPALQAQIPLERCNQAADAARELGEQVHSKFPFSHNAGPVAGALDELVLNRTWRPALEVTGVRGIPDLADAGNVLRPTTALKLSMRLPPTCDSQLASEEIKTLLEANPPYGAHVVFDASEPANGWNAPAFEDWLLDSMHAASKDYFEKPAAFMGEGGSIPFMAMLGDAFPDAQFVVTGVLGPHSNAHGPNEFLHLPTAERITCCVARILADHCNQHARLDGQENAA